jgi:hypothetical protein
MKKIGLLPFSSFKLVVSGSPIRTSCVSNLASGHFPCLNPAHTPFPQMCQFFARLGNLAPKPAEVLDVGFQCDHVPANYGTVPTVRICDKWQARGAPSVEAKKGEEPFENVHKSHVVEVTCGAYKTGGWG